MSLFVISFVAGATVLLALLFERLDELHRQLNEALDEGESRQKVLKLHADIMSVAKEIDRITAGSDNPPTG